MSFTSAAVRIETRASRRVEFGRDDRSSRFVFPVPRPSLVADFYYTFTRGSRLMPTRDPTTGARRNDAVKTRPSFDNAFTILILVLVAGLRRTDRSPLFPSVSGWSTLAERPEDERGEDTCLKFSRGADRGRDLH